MHKLPGVHFLVLLRPAAGLMLPSPSATAVPQQPLRVEHYSVEQGLSQSSIRCIARDSSGFMWFGSDDGLNRFDGLTFTTFHHEPDDSSSIPDDSIWAQAADMGEGKPALAHRHRKW